VENEAKENPSNCQWNRKRLQGLNSCKVYDDDDDDDDDDDEDDEIKKWDQIKNQLHHYAILTISMFRK